MIAQIKIMVKTLSSFDWEENEEKLIFISILSLSEGRMRERLTQEIADIIMMNPVRDMRMG